MPCFGTGLVSLECTQLVVFYVSFRDIDEIVTVLEESQKVFDVNPWDFEPDFYPTPGDFSFIACFIIFIRICLCYSLSLRYIRVHYGFYSASA